MSCKHTRIRERNERAFQAPVAREPYTDENPAAHGNVTWTEHCLDCGATRAVNANQGHREYGPWSLEGGR